jgi:hypothetical protein
MMGRKRVHEIGLSQDTVDTAIKAVVGWGVGRVLTWGWDRLSLSLKKD